MNQEETEKSSFNYFLQIANNTGTVNNHCYNAGVKF